MSEWNEATRKASEEMEDFILNTTWEDFPSSVQERVVTCVVDLFDVMIACSTTEMAKKGVNLACDIYAKGNIPIIGSESTFNFVGAVTAYGYNVNALDIDDGHNMVKGHPGAVLIAGILPAALKVGATYKEFLTAMVIGYEVVVRSGLALHQYYNFAHATGAWGAIGVAAGVGRLYGLDRETLSHALAIADYQAPIAPIMRDVEIPSMNKDGIAYGAITGAMAVESAMRGITGQFYNLLEPEYHNLVHTLGKEYEILNIYFKYFPCCRWAHAPILGATGLCHKHHIGADQIANIYIRTFKAATQLSSCIPVLSDEAQYNMIYPVCAAIIEGQVTPREVSEVYIASHKNVIELMDKVRFEVDEMFEQAFPKKRFAQVEIQTKTGETYTSKVCEPLGEKEANIDLEWVTEKFDKISGAFFDKQYQENLITQLCEVDTCVQLEKIISYVNMSINKNL